MTTRAEHMKWAKDRALEYADQGDTGNAIASLMSDLGKHPENGVVMRCRPGSDDAAGDDRRVREARRVAQVHRRVQMMTTTTHTPISCRCRALIVPLGDGGNSWVAVSGERPGDLWCPGGQLHAPAENGTEDSPLTCEWCKREVATHVAVLDLKSRRVKSFIGQACIPSWGHAPDIAVSPRCTWRFRLVPDNGTTEPETTTTEGI
jgi:hypothetical protein